MIARIILIPEEIKERDFPDWIMCKDKRIEVIKFDTDHMNLIIYCIEKIKDYSSKKEYYKRIIDRLSFSESLGAPDFFVTNGETFFLAEFKSYRDKLSQEQIIWFEKNQDLPLAIIMAYSSNIELKDKQYLLSANILTDEEKNNFDYGFNFNHKDKDKKLDKVLQKALDKYEEVF